VAQQTGMKWEEKTYIIPHVFIDVEPTARWGRKPARRRLAWPARHPA